MSTALTILGIGIVRAPAERLCSILLPLLSIEVTGNWVEPVCALYIGLVSLQSSIAFKGAWPRLSIAQPSNTSQWPVLHNMREVVNGMAG